MDKETAAKARSSWAKAQGAQLGDRYQSQGSDAYSDALDGTTEESTKNANDAGKRQAAKNMARQKKIDDALRKRSLDSAGKAAAKKLKAKKAKRSTMEKDMGERGIPKEDVKRMKQIN